MAATKTRTKTQAAKDAEPAAEPVFLAPRNQELRLLRRSARTTIIDGRPFMEPEVVYEFHGGRYSPAADAQLAGDPEKIADAADWIRQHAYSESGAVLEEGVISVPAPTAALDEIVGASVEGDIDTLLQIREDEQNGRNRDEVLRAVQVAITKLEDMGVKPNGERESPQSAGGGGPQTGNEGEQPLPYPPSEDQQPEDNGVVISPQDGGGIPPEEHPREP